MSAETLKKFGQTAVTVVLVLVVLHYAGPAMLKAHTGTT